MKKFQITVVERHEVEVEEIGQFAASAPTPKVATPAHTCSCSGPSCSLPPVLSGLKPVPEANYPGLASNHVDQSKPGQTVNADLILLKP